MSQRFCKYKLFEIKSGENIMDIYKHFSNLVNKLKGLGKRFETIELVKKVLRFLSEFLEYEGNCI